MIQRFVRAVGVALALMFRYILPEALCSVIINLIPLLYDQNIMTRPSLGRHARCGMSLPTKRNLRPLQ